MQEGTITGQAQALVAAGREADAVRLLEEGAAKGDALALFTLADWRLRGVVLPQDPCQARELFRRAGEAGLRPAGFFYTNFLASGVGGAPDWATALSRLRAEAAADPRRVSASALVGKMRLTPTGDPLSIPPPQRLSDAPHVLLFPRLFSAEECDYLTAAAEPGFQPSVVLKRAGGGEFHDPIRTSEGSTFHWLVEDPAVHALNRRLAAASGTTVEQGEPLQVLRYRPGQQYRSHLDAIPGLANQRIATALVYLNEEYTGGETAFVRTGLKVKGRKGDAIVFRNTRPDGRADPLSEHAGLPVATGVKLLASRWICERPY